MVRCVRREVILVGTGGAADSQLYANCVRCDHLEQDTFPGLRIECRQTCRIDADAVEFRASKRTGAGRAWFSLRVNDGHVVLNRVPLCEAFRTYHCRCLMGQPVWGVRIDVEQEAGRDLADGAAPTAPRSPAMSLDHEFGFRVRGQHVLHLLRAAYDRRSLPVGYGVENSLELVVHGLSGREQIDVFLNGFSVQCEANLRIGTPLTPLRLRYLVGPLSCTIRTVIIRVAWCEGGDELDAFYGSAAPGVIVSCDFGVMVAGQDCLPTADFLELRRQQRGGPCDPKPDPAMVRSGRWLQQGDYLLLPYVCRRKPHDPAAAAESKTAALPVEAALNAELEVEGLSTEPL